MSTFRNSKLVILSAVAAHSLSTGKKPFPRLRPLISPTARCAAAGPVDDILGIANEEAMLSASRPGQDSFDIDAGKTDPRGAASSSTRVEAVAPKDAASRLKTA